MWQPPFLLNQLIDIPLQVLEYKIELIVAFDELDECYDVGMMQPTQNSHFVEVDTLLPLLISFLHMLDSHYPTSTLIDSLDNTSKSAITKFAPQFVFLH